MIYIIESIIFRNFEIFLHYLACFIYIFHAPYMTESRFEFKHATFSIKVMSENVTEEKWYQ